MVPTRGLTDRFRVAHVTRVVALLAALLVGQTTVMRAVGADAAQLEAAREEAREAAAAFAETESRIGELESQQERTQASIAATRASYEELRSTVAEQVVQEYMRAGGADVALVSGDLNVSARASALARAARGQARSQADKLAATRALLVRQEADLARQRQEAEEVRAAQRERQAELYAALAELEAIEAQRLESERQAEQARRLAAAQAAWADAEDDSSSGSGATPGATPPRPVVPLDWLCPITGGYTFGDTWGDPRSGGRSHRGTDVFADYGTPLVAVVGGEAVNYGWSSAGGYDVFLLGDDGNRYYYAHLDSFPNLGRMEQGDVVGYVGDTGNASGVPHLHFEIHPGGSGWVNPYPTLALYC